MSHKITDKFVRGQLDNPPASSNKLFYDEQVKGFAVRITKGGCASFVLNYYASGRERRYTIGQYPDWGVSAARQQATELRRRINNGEDPLVDRITEREAPTMKDLYERYCKEHLIKKRARSAKDDKSMWENYILKSYANVKVADLTASQVDALHASISLNHKIRANRVIEILSKAMNLAIRWEYRTENPCKGCHQNREHKRERFLVDEEMNRLVDALNNHRMKVSCNAIKLLILTGARKSEVLSARWDMFDLDRGIWTKPAPDTKQDQIHTVPLSDIALELLRGIRKLNPSSYYVFPGTNPDKPLTDIKKTWVSVKKSANISDIVLHDIRHSFASALVSKGVGLPVIGRLLGHTQAQTTLRYAHLYRDPLRAAADIVGGIVDDQEKRRANAGRASRKFTYSKIRNKQAFDSAKKKSNSGA